MVCHVWCVLSGARCVWCGRWVVHVARCMVYLCVCVWRVVCVPYALPPNLCDHASSVGVLPAALVYSAMAGKTPHACSAMSAEQIHGML